MASQPCSSRLKKHTLKLTASKKHINQFTTEQKVKLATTIEQNPKIWKLDHPKYKKRDTHTKIWKSIAEIAQLPVEDERNLRKSMRDSLRYRRQESKPVGKSGDSGDEEGVTAESGRVDDDHNLTSWEFWDCMKFLVLQKSGRTTILSLDTVINADESNNAEASDNDVIQNDPVVDINDSEVSSKSTSNYEYMTSTKQTRKRPASGGDGGKAAERIATGIESLIKICKESLPASSGLVYESMYTNLDRMLKQLPASVVEDLNIQFVQLTYDALKIQRCISI